MKNGELILAIMRLQRHLKGWVVEGFCYHGAHQKTAVTVAVLDETCASVAPERSPIEDMDLIADLAAISIEFLLKRRSAELIESLSSTIHLNQLHADFTEYAQEVRVRLKNPPERVMARSVRESRNSILDWLVFLISQFHWLTVGSFPLKEWPDMPDDSIVYRLNPA